MTLDAMSITLGVILVSLLVAYATFAYRYARHSPWNATWNGVVLEAQKVTLAATVLFFLFDTFMEDYWPGRYSILLILLTLLSIEAWATLLGLLHVQRKRGGYSRRRRAKAEKPLPDVDQLQ